MKRLAILFTVALAAIGLAQPIMGPSPSPGNMILKVDVVTNLQQMRPDISDKLVVLILGTNTIWDGGAAYYRADPTNALPHSIPNVITSSITSTGRWIKITELTATTGTNVTNSIIDVPEYYAMLYSYDEFGTYDEGPFTNPPANAHGWDGSWEVVSGSAYITNRWPSGTAPFRTNYGYFYQDIPQMHWQRSDNRLVLSGADTEVRRKMTNLPADWERIRLAIRYTPLVYTNTIVTVASNWYLNELSFTNGGVFFVGFCNSTNGSWYAATNYHVGAQRRSNTPKYYTQRTILSDGFWHQGHLDWSLLDSQWLAVQRADSTSDWIHPGLNDTTWIGSYGDLQALDESASWANPNVIFLDIVRDWVDGMPAIQVVVPNQETAMNTPVPDEGKNFRYGQILEVMGMNGLLYADSYLNIPGSIAAMTGPVESPWYSDGSEPAIEESLEYGSSISDFDSISIVWNRGDSTPLEVADVTVRVFADSLSSAPRIPTNAPIVLNSYVSGTTLTIIRTNVFSVPILEAGIIAMFQSNGLAYGQGFRTNNGYFWGAGFTYNASSGNKTSTYSGWAPGTYNFRYHYYNDGGLGPSSATNTFTILPSLALYPEPVPYGSTNLADGNTSQSVSWDDVTGEDGYIVLWRTNSLASWEVVTNTAANVTNATKYFASLDCAATNHMWVVATNLGGTTNFQSNVLDVTGLGAKWWLDVLATNNVLTSLAAPAGVNDDVQTWTDSISGDSFTGNSYLSTNGVGQFDDLGNTASPTLLSSPYAVFSLPSTFYSVAKENTHAATGTIMSSSLAAEVFPFQYSKNTTNSWAIYWDVYAGAGFTYQSATYTTNQTLKHFGVGVTVAQWGGLAGVYATHNGRKMVGTGLLGIGDQPYLNVLNKADETTPFNGWIKSFVACTNGHSDALRVKMNSWLANYYGFTP